MIEILVTFDNAEFLRTKINATLPEAKEYYINQDFTFGIDEDEYTSKAVNVFLYDKWKYETLKEFQKHKEPIVNFDDEKEIITFINHYDDIVTIPYWIIKNAISKSA